MSTVKIEMRVVLMFCRDTLADVVLRYGGKKEIIEKQTERSRSDC